MKRAKTVEAVWCIAAVLGLVILAATLWIAQSQPQGYFSGEGGFSIITSNHHTTDIGCEFWCKMVITWIINQSYQIVKNNGCDGACGGGGGGGFACSDNDPDPNCRMDTW